MCPQLVMLAQQVEPRYLLRLRVCLTDSVSQDTGKGDLQWVNLE